MINDGMQLEFFPKPRLSQVCLVVSAVGIKKESKQPLLHSQANNQRVASYKSRSFLVKTNQIIHLHLEKDQEFNLGEFLTFDK